MVEIIDEMEYLRKMAGYYESSRSMTSDLMRSAMKSQNTTDEIKQKLIRAMLKAGIDDVELNGRHYIVETREYYTISEDDPFAPLKLLKGLGQDGIIRETVDDADLTLMLRNVSNQYKTAFPDSKDSFPAEYEELLTHLEKETEYILVRTVS